MIHNNSLYYFAAATAGQIFVLGPTLCLSRCCDVLYLNTRQRSEYTFVYVHWLFLWHLQYVRLSHISTRIQ